MNPEVLDRALEWVAEEAAESDLSTATPAEREHLATSARRVAEALCGSGPDALGLCPRCGFVFDDGRNGAGHNPDGCNPFRGLLLMARAVRACWRRFHYLRSAPPPEEDRL